MLVPLEALLLPGSSMKTTLKRRKPQLPLGMTEHLRDMSGGRGWVHVARKIIFCHNFIFGELELRTHCFTIQSERKLHITSRAGRDTRKPSEFLKRAHFLYPQGSIWNLKSQGPEIGASWGF